ncbi:MAG: hypothetical protein WBL74_12525 [Novosphingobium sp.]|uniref:hypothetical protein n=1 Tax=Novosphingobium sp. TaxID=1874826 RepID=UPI003C7DF4A4
MKRLVLLSVALSSTLLAGSSDPGAPLVAADEAFSKESQRDGNWTAARRMALPESETFAPGRVKVLEFGKSMPDPPFTQSWKPEQVWISCDGTAGITFGSWKIAGTRYKGTYESVWGRMANGSYRVLLRRGGMEPRKLLSRPGRKGMRAACTGKPFIAIQAPAEGDDFKFGTSNDNSLNWTSLVTKPGEVQIVVRIWDGKDFVTVLEDVAPAPAPR